MQPLHADDRTGRHGAGLEPAGGPGGVGRSRLTAWLVLGGCLLLAMAPMMGGLGRAGPRSSTERRALTLVNATRRHYADRRYERGTMDWLVPWRAGEPLLKAAPGASWFHRLALALPGANRGPARLRRLRLVSVGFALLTVATVYWVGLSLGGLLTAALAGLICLANPILLYDSRLATGDMPTVGLVGLSIATAIWAIRPLRPPPGIVRQAVGWGVCGLAMGLATLTGGLIALAATGLPLIGILILCPGRLSHGLGLAAAGCLVGLVTGPWVVHVHTRNPEIWQAWLASLGPEPMQRPEQIASAMGQRMGGLLLALLPWTGWAMAAVIQPLSTSSGGARLRLFLGWIWFVPVALLTVASPAMGLLALPPASLLTGQAMRRYTDLSAEGRHARLWRMLRWPHVAVLAAASAAVPLASHLQGRLIDAGWLKVPLLAPMPGLYWFAVAGGLLAIVLFSARCVRDHHPARAVFCWVLWTVGGFAAITFPASF